MPGNTASPGGMAAADGIAQDPPAAMDRWIPDHNTRLTTVGHADNPYDEYVDLKSAFGLPDRLPPLRLPLRAILADQARASRTLARARELALWVGERPRATKTGELTTADTVTAARALGIPLAHRAADSDALPGMPSPPAIRGMRDLPELVHLWWLADDVEFLELSDDQVTVAEGVEEWSGGDDEAVLDIWETAFASTLADSLLIDADLHNRHDLDFQGVGVALVVMLFLARDEGIPLAELSDTLRETATAELSPTGAQQAWQSWIKAYGDPARTLLARLSELGAVEYDDEVARLTPLATAALRRQLVDAGVQIPLLPPMDQMSVADLVVVAQGGSMDELAAEEANWLGMRAPDDAVRELLAAAAAGGPPARVYATSVATRIGAAAEPQWRAALDDQWLRPYAKIALAGLASPQPGALPPALQPSREDLGWILTDVLASTFDVLEPEELERQLRDAVPAGEELAVFETMWRLPHPDAADVLKLIGAHHPDKKIAKAARKAAYKASSRRG